jgi:hypothetical protein
LKRAHRPDHELEEMREADPNDRIVLRHRTVDSLGKLLRSGAVTEAMHDAGHAFQRYFQFAGLDPIRARSMMLPVSGGGAPELTERQLDARHQVYTAMQALGGLSSPAGSCVWHVIGLQRSVREWATTCAPGAGARHPDRGAGDAGEALRNLAWAGIPQRCFGWNAWVI